MIDIVGHAGHLYEAENLIDTKLYKNVALAWVRLLGASRIHVDFKRTVCAAKQCFAPIPKSVDPSLMLSNIYGSRDRSEELAKVTEEIKCNLGRG